MTGPWQPRDGPLPWVTGLCSADVWFVCVPGRLGDRGVRFHDTEPWKPREQPLPWVTGKRWCAVCLAAAYALAGYASTVVGRLSLGTSGSPQCGEQSAGLWRQQRRLFHGAVSFSSAEGVGTGEGAFPRRTADGHAAGHQSGRRIRNGGALTSTTVQLMQQESCTL